MTEKLPTSVRAEIVRLVQDLVAARFFEITRDGRAGRLTVEEVQGAVNEYPGTLVPPPDDFWKEVYVYPIEGKVHEWSVDVPLYTKEEGYSDLTLQLRARTEREPFVSIDDIRVL